MYNGNRKNNNYSVEFKIRIVIDKVKNNLGFKETVGKLNLNTFNLIFLSKLLGSHQLGGAFLLHLRVGVFWGIRHQYNRNWHSLY